MPSDIDRLTQDYRITLLRYLGRTEEAALNAGYALGRQALSSGVSLLDLVQVHHTVLAESLEPHGADRPASVVMTAGTFFAEVVAPYEMTRRGALERE